MTFSSKKINTFTKIFSLPGYKFSSSNILWKVFHDVKISKIILQFHVTFFADLLSNIFCPIFIFKITKKKQFCPQSAFFTIKILFLCFSFVIKKALKKLCQEHEVKIKKWQIEKYKAKLSSYCESF